MGALLHANHTAAGFTAAAYFPTGDSSPSNSTTESKAQDTVRTAGTYSKLAFRIVSNTSTGSVTWRFRKNGSDGNLSVSVPAATTGYFSDTSNSDTVAAGDLINIAGGGSGGTATLDYLAIVFEATDGSYTKRFAPYSPFFAFINNATRWTYPVGQVTYTGSETFRRAVIRAAGTVKNLAVLIGSNSRGVTDTFISRVNGADGNLTVSVGANQTGTFEDTVNTDAVAVDDTFTWQMVAGASASAHEHNIIGCDIEFTGDEYQANTSGGFIGNNSTVYRPIGGNGLGRATAAQADTTWLLGDTTVDRLAIDVFNNSSTTDPTVVTLQINDADGNQTISIPAGTTGIFTDSSNTDSITTDDEICIKLVTPNTSGALQLAGAALRFVPDAGGGEVTGTGTLESDSAIIDGAGVSSSTGTGSPDSQSATVDGSGMVHAAIGSGDLTAQSATVEGEGTSSSTGSGAITSSATVEGEGTSSSTGSGDLVAQNATIEGEGLLNVIGSGELTAGNAATDGEGVSESTGSGTLVAQGATVEGTGASTVSGSGDLAAQSATIAGTGVSGSTGSGDPQAGSATVEGSGTGIVSGSGDIESGAATVEGSGVSESTGSGDLVAQSPTASGDGVTGSTGEGDVAASNADVSGVSGPISGTGTLVTGNTELEGSGTSGSVGTGALTSLAAADGAGTSGSTATGALVAGAAANSGEGTSGSTGSGEANPNAPQIEGVGTSSSTGSGAIEAGNTDSAGAGTSGSTGTGALVAAVATIVGTEFIEFVVADLTIQPYMDGDVTIREKISSDLIIITPYVEGTPSIDPE